MTRTNQHIMQSVATVAVMAAGLLFSGCQGSHPDQKGAAVHALADHGLYSVMVAQDRHTGVLTLTGDVGSDSVKSQAENLAGKAAPDYTIANQIRVISTGIAPPAPSPGGGQ